MSFTYDEYSLDQALYRIRLELGDTDPDRPLLQDEEIEQIIDEKTSFNARVAACCRLICSIFAGSPTSYRLESFREEREEIYTRYLDMAKLYEARSGTVGAPWAGSTSKTWKDSVEDNTDLVKPKFKKGMHDNN